MSDATVWTRLVRLEERLEEEIATFKAQLAFQEGYVEGLKERITRLEEREDRRS